MADPKCLHCVLTAAVDQWANSHNGGKVSLAEFAGAAGSVLDDLVVKGELSHVECTQGIIEALLKGYSVDRVKVVVKSDEPAPPSRLN